jgi:hypothetical protein
MAFLFALVAYIGLITFLVVRERSWRVAAAFLVAPLAPALVAGIGSPVSPILALVFAPFCYLFALLGVPAYFALRRMGWLSLWQVIIAAAVLGFLAGLLLELGGGGVISRALGFGAYGAITGLAFWIIAFARAKPNFSFKSRRPTGAA